MTNPTPSPVRIRSHRSRSAQPDNIAELTRHLPLWPEEIADRSIAGRRKLIATIEKALRAERRRGRGGHWAYDLARHTALHRCWQREVAALKDLEAVDKIKGLRDGRPLVSSQRKQRAE